MPLPRSTDRQRAAFPAAPVAQWTYDDAVRAVEATATARLAPSAYTANEAYLAGDHWQEGATWVGPRGDDATWPDTRRQVRRQYTSEGVVGEVLGRFSNGLLKREAGLDFTPADLAADATPSAAQQKEAAAMVAFVSGWWDRVRLWEDARESVRRVRALSRGVLRLGLATGALERGVDGVPVIPTGLPLADAFRMVTVDAPDPAACALVEEARTCRPVAVVLYTIPRSEGGGDEKYAELWTVGPIATAPTGDPTSEPTAANETPAAQRLHVRRLYDAGSVAAGAASRQDLALPFGTLPVAEMRGSVLITEAVRELQASLDLGSSTLNRNIETSGFRERYIGNAEPVGTWVPEDPGVGGPTKQVDGQTYWLVPETRTLGSSITTELVGIEDVGPDGVTRRATPSVTFADPTDPDFAIKVKSDRRAAILHECHQAHVLESGAVASGYSRQQARADYEADLHAVRPSVEGALREIVTGAIAWALTMADPAEVRAAGIQPDFLTRYRCVIQCHVDPGPLAPDERLAVLAELAAGTRSRKSAMAALGTEDVDAELQALAGETGYQVAHATTVAAALKALAELPGATLDGAVRYLVAKGIDATELPALLAEATDGGTTTGTPSTDPMTPDASMAATQVAQELATTVAADVSALEDEVRRLRDLLTTTVADMRGLVQTTVASVEQRAVAAEQAARDAVQQAAVTAAQQPPEIHVHAQIVEAARPSTVRVERGGGSAPLTVTLDRPTAPDAPDAPPMPDAMPVA